MLSSCLEIHTMPLFFSIDHLTLLSPTLWHLQLPLIPSVEPVAFWVRHWENSFNYVGFWCTHNPNWKDCAAQPPRKVSRLSLSNWTPKRQERSPSKTSFNTCTLSTTIRRQERLRHWCTTIRGRVGPSIRGSEWHMRSLTEKWGRGWWKRKWLLSTIKSKNRSLKRLSLDECLFLIISNV